MSGAEGSKKGDALEIAVRMIEETILQSFPDYAECSFRIEGKKRIEVSGVPHEIDVYVTIDLPGGYENVVIFECKNWKDPVSKNEVIIFSEKINASGARKGFLVAKEYAASAVAQAALNNRVRLLTAEELDPVAVMPPCGFQGLFWSVPSAKATVAGFKIPSDSAAKPLDAKAVAFVVDNEPVSLEGFVRSLVIECVEREQDRFQTQIPAEGLYKKPFFGEKTFEEGRAFVDGKAIRSVSVCGEAQVQVTKGAVVSAFDVATRGRVINMQLDFGSSKIQASFVDALRA